MSITPKMTLGHMKQIIRRLDGSVPIILTRDEAEFFTRSEQINGELDTFWFRVRNLPKKRVEIYPVYVDGSIKRTVNNHHLELANDRADEEVELERLAEKFIDMEPRLEALEICEVSGTFETADQIRDVLHKQGYISASFDDLIAFATQHADYFARPRNAYVHILEETDSGKFPLIWFDGDPISGYSHQQIAFDDLDEGLLNQISASSISVLAKKRDTHRSLEPDECNKTISSLEARIAEDAALMEEMGTQIYEGGKLLEEARESLESTIEQRVIAFAAVQAYARLIRKLIDNPFLRFLPGITAWLEELGDNPAIRKCLDEFVSPK